MPTKKYTKAELEAWVGQWGLPDDKKQQVLAALGDEAVVGHIGEAVLMRSDYDRSYSELSQQREEIERNAQQTMELRVQLENWRTTNQPLFEQATTRVRQLEAENARLVSKYVEGGGSIDDFTPEPVAPKPPAAAAATAPDLSGYVRNEDLQTGAANMLRVQGVMMQLNSQHRQLFGSDIADPAAFIESALKAKKPLNEFFRETYKVAEKEQELAATQRQAEIDAAVRDARAKWETERDMSVTHTDNLPSFMEQIARGNAEQAADPKARTDSRNAALNRAVTAVAEKWGHEGITGL